MVRDRDSFREMNLYFIRQQIRALYDHLFFSRRNDDAACRRFVRSMDKTGEQLRPSFVVVVLVVIVVV